MLHLYSVTTQDTPFYTICSVRKKGSHITEDFIDWHFPRPSFRDSYDSALRGRVRILDSETKEELIRELQENHIKISPDKVVFITRMKENQKTVWLEEGTNKAGEAHLYSEHGPHFDTALQLNRDAIPPYLKNLIENADARIKEEDEDNPGSYDYYYEVKDRRNKWIFVVICVADNGYIVTAYPHANPVHGIIPGDDKGAENERNSREEQDSTDNLHRLRHWSDRRGLGYGRFRQQEDRYRHCHR